MFLYIFDFLRCYVPLLKNFFWPNFASTQPWKVLRVQFAFSVSPAANGVLGLLRFRFSQCTFMSCEELRKWIVDSMDEVHTRTRFRRGHFCLNFNDSRARVRLKFLQTYSLLILHVIEASETLVFKSDGRGQSWACMIYSHFKGTDPMQGRLAEL